METNIPIEQHPWPPFMPSKPTLLMLGTFPPKREKWSMDFYYPNKINDMWRVMGIVFGGDRDRYWDSAGQRFDLPAIKALLSGRGIALWDTAMAVRRLRDNASDKFLDIVRPIDLPALLAEHPGIAHVATAGEKATVVVAGMASAPIPAVGQSVACKLGGRAFRLWRMPSTSRAYPLPLERKAATYRAMFLAAGILPDD